MIAGEPIILGADRRERVIKNSVFGAHVVITRRDSQAVVHRSQVRPALSQRQRQAYKNLAAQGYVILTGSTREHWPPQAVASGPVYAASTLRALVEAGVASWSENRHYITHRPIGD